MLGREIPLPVDYIIDRGELNTEKTLHSYAQDLEDRLRIIHESAREKLQIAGERQKRSYNRNVKDWCYKKGDVVMLQTTQRRKGLSPKLQPKWTGPFLITDQLSDVTYRIRKSKKSKASVVHHNRLKLYPGEIPIDISKMTQKQNLKTLVNVAVQTDQNPKLRIRKPVLVKRDRHRRSQDKRCERGKFKVIRESRTPRRSSRLRRIPSWLQDCIRTDKITFH